MRCIYGLTAVFFLLLVMVGCQTDIAANSVSERLQTGTVGKLFRLTEPVSLDLRHGFSAKNLVSNTLWREIGTIAQGSVLKPVDTVLMVNAGDNYEAYLVVKGNQVVGVYLPVESAFVNATATVNVLLAEVTQ